MAYSQGKTKQNNKQSTKLRANVKKETKAGVNQDSYFILTLNTELVEARKMVQG